MKISRTLQKDLAEPTPIAPPVKWNCIGRPSIYFRKPGRVLFEVATAGPGFTIDEPLDQLGSSLRLPKRYEAHRAEIERILPPLRVP